MTVDELAAELEADLAWRQSELRHLRNELLGDVHEPSVAAMRAIMVMQYAHLEGFTRTALAAYVAAVNSTGTRSDAVQEHLLTAAVLAEFQALRKGNLDGGDDEEGRLMRRARREVTFVQRLRNAAASELEIAESYAVDMEANLGSDVLKRSLFRLAIPPGEIDNVDYKALDFVKNARNDIAHGDRKVRMEPGKFNAQVEKADRLMGTLLRLVARAFRERWYLAGSVTVV